MHRNDPEALRALLELRHAVDAALEASLQAGHGVGEVLSRLMPEVAARTGARAMLVRTFQEDLDLATFAHGAAADRPVLEALLPELGPGAKPTLKEVPGGAVVAQPFDVAGEWFGSALVLVDSEVAEKKKGLLQEQLQIFCEEIDNFLFSIRAAREKQKLMMELADALRHRVLAVGLQRAVAALSRAVQLERLLLVCIGEARGSSVQVQLFEGGKLALDTMGSLPHPADQEAIIGEAQAYLRKNDPALVQRFGFSGAREEVLINGITQAVVIGKLLATSLRGSFNTFERDLLAGFSEFIRQRVVDFDKEWRTLAASFRPDDVGRLLQADDYGERWLSPRERDVAILYVDISGFTKISEQVLKSPSAVAALVEAWSHAAVKLVWDHEGVFDKMVGDCVIALFGPPFYERDPGECLQAAISCARAIRDMTAALPSRPEFQSIADTGLAVSTGVNLAPLFVGRFGPNNNFTGFSSGMNNTARLQGCALRGEILVMSNALARLPPAHGFTFGEERSAKVKNVAEPLKFRPVV